MVSNSSVNGDEGGFLKMLEIIEIDDDLDHITNNKRRANADYFCERWDGIVTLGF